MKHSRSRSVSRITPKVKHITIDDFLPSEEAQPRNEPVPTVIDLSSDIKARNHKAPQITASASKNLQRRTAAIRKITLQTLN